MNRRWMLLCFVLVFWPLFSIIAADRQDEDEEEQSAPDILKDVAEIYSTCDTYYDSGTATHLTIDKDGNRETEKVDFATAFVRSDGFRFQYDEPDNEGDTRYIIWTDGKKVRSWWYIDPGVKTVESLDLAISGALAVSKGASFFIPSLLLPNKVDGPRTTDLEEATKLEDAKIDGVPCIVIRGKWGGDYPITLWIDKESYLIRKLVEEINFTSDFQTVNTLVFDPVMDDEVTEAQLAFDAPEDGRSKAKKT